MIRISLRLETDKDRKKSTKLTNLLVEDIVPEKRRNGSLERLTKTGQVGKFITTNPDLTKVEPRSRMYYMAPARNMLPQEPE